MAISIVNQPTVMQPAAPDANASYGRRASPVMMAATRALPPTTTPRSSAGTVKSVNGVPIRMLTGMAMKPTTRPTAPRKALAASNRSAAITAILMRLSFMQNLLSGSNPFLEDEPLQRQPIRQLSLSARGVPCRVATGQRTVTKFRTPAAQSMSSVAGQILLDSSRTRPGKAATGHSRQGSRKNRLRQIEFARLVTGDAVTEITRLKTEDGGAMDVGGATLAAAAMRALV